MSAAGATGPAPTEGKNYRAVTISGRWNKFWPVEQNPGFDARHLVTFTAVPSLAGYTEEQAKSLRLALTDRVRQMPGVQSVAIASRGLMRGSGIKVTITPPGQQPSPADFLNASLNMVTPGYFETMGMRFVAGRDLTPAD